MPVPLGTDPSIGWCLVWGLFAFGILTASFQLASDASLRAITERRTFNRLGDLNAFLNRQIDEQWKVSNDADIIPDQAALITLKRQVDRAAAVDDWLKRRATCLEVCRLAAGLELVFALVALFVLATGIRPEDVLPPATVTAVIGFSVAVAAFVAALYLGLRVSKGADYL